MNSVTVTPHKAENLYCLLLANFKRLDWTFIFRRHINLHIKKTPEISEEVVQQYIKPKETFIVQLSHCLG